tara:strand:+ start:4000 stop:4422 length:423 start_codon:yes stop_codon:yes gene_type:complete
MIFIQMPIDIQIILYNYLDNESKYNYTRFLQNNISKNDFNYISKFIKLNPNDLNHLKSVIRNNNGIDFYIKYLNNKFLIVKYLLCFTDELYTINIINKYKLHLNVNSILYINNNWDPTNITQLYLTNKNYNNHFYKYLNI